MTRGQDYGGRERSYRAQVSGRHKAMTLMDANESWKLLRKASHKSVSITHLFDWGYIDPELFLTVVPMPFLNEPAQRDSSRRRTMRLSQSP